MQLSSKSALRQKFLDQRMQVSPEGRVSAARAAFDIFFKNVPVPPDAVVAGYWPIRGELDDMPVLRELLHRGQVCALPHVEGDGVPIVFRAWDEAAAMTSGKYGIAEPALDKRVIPDIILVPLVAFDAQCHRLGYGAGFYDRTVARLKKNKPTLAIGLGYELQVCNGLPAEENDVKMDMIVTDKKVYR